MLLPSDRKPFSADCQSGIQRGIGWADVPPAAYY
jgi:hypothetical protein